jgi:mycothiol synthase
VNVTVRGRVGQEETAAVLSLATAAAVADDVAPLSEQVRLHLRYGGDPAATNLLAWRNDELAGFAHLDPPDPAGARSGELVVHPAHRRQGLGRELAGASAAEAGAHPVRIWAHGDLPAAAGLARVARFTRVRALWLMMHSLRLGAPDMPPLPGGVKLRTFVPGRDEAAWLALNRRAFAQHPEQGLWTQADLAHREREPWFDPEGFFLAEREGRLVGFHWTKVHQPGEGLDRTDPVGEVYVVGVDPAEQGTGLGRALTLAGLRHLAARGMPAVMLYVDAGNKPAVRLYESLAFTHTSTDVMYQHPGT